MTDIIDLNERRNERSQPDPEFITQDEYGRKLYTFLLKYEFNGKEYGSRLTAYNEADARAKVAAMRLSLEYEGGPLHCVVPA